MGKHFSSNEEICQNTPYIPIYQPSSLRLLKISAELLLLVRLKKIEFYKYLFLT